MVGRGTNSTRLVSSKNVLIFRGDVRDGGEGKIGKRAIKGFWIYTCMHTLRERDAQTEKFSGELMLLPHSTGIASGRSGPSPS